MARIPDTLRQQIIERARGLCEYCQSAKIIIETMEVDHIRPRSERGETTFDNLALVCRGCNSFKLSFQTGIDPTTGAEVPLFNPRSQEWQEHFQWAGDGAHVVGLTAIGRATVERLKMNRESIIESRLVWVQAGWHPPKSGKFPMD
ncbi:MAG: HNH endonuclease [Anaerolineae bacterium]|nr:HNH endonuclease [Anaerolineae bacterium]